MMYQKLTSKEAETINQVQKITSTDYEMLGEFIPYNSFMCIIEDLLMEYDRVVEENKELKEEKEYGGEYEDFY